MNDDYLWDKSGEHDPEVERLERLLGKFHHQPQPLDLPVATSRRVLIPGLAVAAAVALIAVALGVWLNWQEDQKEAAPPEMAKVAPVEEKKEQKTTVIEPVKSGEGDVPAVSGQKPRHRAPRYQPEGRSGLVKASLTEEEKAKAQLMLALHIASSKLNLAQKKIQAGEKTVPRS